MKRGLITEDVANNPELLVDVTDYAAVVPSGVSEGREMQVMKDLGRAESAVQSGDWKYVDGSERGEVMTIYRNGALPGRFAAPARHPDCRPAEKLDKVN